LTAVHPGISPESPSERLDSHAGWLFLAVVLVILAGTLFPYRFSIEETASHRVGFFLFWFIPLQKGWAGWLLNLTMFLPFGFGLAWWARVKGWRLISRPLAIGAAGFLFSYLVEFLQLFVMWRGSSWDDVLLNTAGAVVGWLLFERWGAGLRRSAEAVVTGFITIFER
jgi:glycopeptide antibiotics resistance protein